MTHGKIPCPSCNKTHSAWGLKQCARRAKDIAEHPPTLQCPLCERKYQDVPFGTPLDSRGLNGHMARKHK